MNEREFLKILEKRAEEQEQLISQIPFPKIFTTTCLWLGKHPYRFLIPAGIILTLLFRLVLGERYFNLILKIFGGFGIIFE